jgi:hypothetical protein
MELLAASWREISEDTIENCFKKCGFKFNTIESANEINNFSETAK